MSNNDINFSAAEKFSYAYVDDKYAKIAVTAQGSAVLADPLTWSYAETHSYVKVDPSSISVSIPSGVDEIYAKVVYLPDFTNILSSVLESLEKDPVFKQISGGFASKQYVDNAITVKQDLITSESKLPYEMISGMTSIEITNSNYDNFIVKDSNILLGALSSISVSGDKLQMNIGINNETSGLLAYAHGKNNKALGKYSVADGYKNIAIGEVSHAEGTETRANKDYSHSEGQQTYANGKASHAEGNQTTSNGEGSHSEGFKTVSTGIQSHAEGNETESVGSYSHSEGSKTTANGGWSHAEGDLTVANGQASHAEGAGTIASGHAQHVEGTFNVALSGYQHIVGSGNGSNDRKNIQTFDWQGNEWIAGNLSASDFIAGSHKLSEKISESQMTTYIDQKIADIEIQGGGFDQSILSAYATTGYVDEKITTISVPTKVSELANDSGFITGYTETEPAFAAQSGNFAEKSNIFHVSESRFGGFNTDLTQNQVVSGNQLVKEIVTSFQFNKQGTILKAGDYKFNVTSILISPNNNLKTRIDDYGDELNYLGFTCIGERVNIPPKTYVAMLNSPDVAIPSAICPNIDKVIFLYVKENNRTYSIYGNTNLVDDNIDKLIEHLSDLDKHVTSLEKTTWNSKVSTSDLSAYVLSSDLNDKIDNLAKPYNLSIGNGNNFFNQDKIEISALMDHSPIIVSSFVSGSVVSIPSSILSSSNISYNNLITREIWIGVPRNATVNFDTSSLSSNYDIIGDYFPETLSGSTTKNNAYYVYVMRCNTKGTIDAELAFSHIFNTNGEF